MGHVERNRDAGNAVGREPVVGQPAVRSERNPSPVQLVIESLDAILEYAAFDTDAEVTDAPVQKLVVRQVHPLLCAVLTGRSVSKCSAVVLLSRYHFRRFVCLRPLKKDGSAPSESSSRKSNEE